MCRFNIYAWQLHCTVTGADLEFKKCVCLCVGGYTKGWVEESEYMHNEIFIINTFTIVKLCKYKPFYITS